LVYVYSGYVQAVSDSVRSPIQV